MEDTIKLNEKEKTFLQITLMKVDASDLTTDELQTYVAIRKKLKIF